MDYRKLNISIGWLVFLIATAVYFITLEDTVSLWDCGEYIMAAYKLEVGHPPGAPLFMLLGRLFTFFAIETDVALWINRMSALSSSFTILFMFWSITSLVRKMVLQRKSELSKGDLIAIMGSGVVGALAYTFSETFWFSAVEGEVYAMSSLFTALVFWAILKWDEEMSLLQSGKLSVEAAPNRWLLLILFLIGLAIGVHLLGILLVPAIGYVIYFRIWKKVDAGTFILTGVISLIVLAVIQEGVIPGTISMASSFEIFFRNSLGLPFSSGTIFFFFALFGALIFGIRYARKTKRTVLYNSLFALVFLFIGYGSFAVIVIRSNADTPMDQNNPENLVNLHSYLKREQYGSTPLLSGPYWNSMENGGQFIDGKWELRSSDEWSDRGAIFARRFIVHKNDAVMSVFLKEKDAAQYAKENGAEYKEEFYETNAEQRLKAIPTYAQTTIFPRMYSGDEPRKVDGYKNWSGYDASRTDGEKGKDNLPLPSFDENIRYFTAYQVNWMYFRYFLWNFAGRQNDIQGDGNQMNGNWKSGFSFIDDIRLGDQSKAPYYTTNNPSNNSFFFFPLILGLIGMFFHAYRAPKDAFVVFLGFLLTGLAIVIYLNQKVYEPRERDYAYAGSFYFFTMWIGVGVYALYHAFTSFGKEHLKKFGIIAASGLLLFFIFDMSSENSLPNTLSWLTIALIAFVLLNGMTMIGKVVKNEAVGAGLATVLGLVAPIIMGAQGWDDHDRSEKTIAHDVAYNYLVGVSPNGIIFTNGDNDTFPLWYIQEVENYRTDVRVCNLSLMQTDWYTSQMMRKTYESDPLPIKFTPDQVLMNTGKTDQVFFSGQLVNMYLSGMISTETSKKIIEIRVKTNRQAAINSINQFALTMNGVMSSFEISQPAVQKRVNQLREIITRPAQEGDLVNDIHLRFSAMRELYSAFSNQSITPSETAINGFQGALDSIEKGWESMDLTEVMAFVRDDANMINNNRSKVRFFPTTKFTLKVNKDNVIKSEVLPANTDKSKIRDVINFEITSSYLTREEVMMLDVLANNDWKRGIYFSNAHASSVSKALLKGNALKQTGSCFEVNPLKTDVPIEVDEMYESLMNIGKKGQRFGKMNDPKVLTDYYARRHVTMFRHQFATLSRYYLHRIQQAEQIKNFPEANFAQLLSQPGVDVEDYTYLRKNADQVIADSKKKVSNLLNRAQQVMPVEFVLDNGEPNVTSTFNYQGGTYPRYSDGVAIDFVQMLYDADDNESAEKLGLELEKQYKQGIEFFLIAPSFITLSSQNQSHFYSLVDSYLQLLVASNDKSGNPDGALAKKTEAFVNQLFDKSLPELFKRIDEEILDAGENRRAKIATSLSSLKDYMEALSADYFGNKSAVPMQNNSDINFEELIQEQEVRDRDSTQP